MEHGSEWRRRFARHLKRDSTLHALHTETSLPATESPRLVLIISAEDRRDEAIRVVRREMERAMHRRDRRGPAFAMETDPPPRPALDSGSFRVALVPRRPIAPARVHAPREVYLELGNNVTLREPDASEASDAAALLGAQVVHCRSLADLAEAAHRHVESFLAEVDLAYAAGTYQPRLGVLWYLCGFALFALCPGPWLRHFDIDFQLPPLDWRVLAPRHTEYVPIWVAPTIGVGVLVFLAYTLWRVRRIRLRLAAVGRETDAPRPSPAAPIVAALLLVPFATNTFFTFRFFRDGRVIEIATEAIHSQGLGMLTTYYPFEEFDFEQDQFRYARPRYHMSPNILPFWQPWAVAIVFILSFIGMALLAAPRRRRILFGSRRLRPMAPGDQGDRRGGPYQ